jgi:hypothetical protein
VILSRVDVNEPAASATVDVPRSDGYVSRNAATGSPTSGPKAAMYTSALTFAFPAAAALITAPPYECPTTTTSPVCASISRRVVSTSPASDASEFCTATTRYPSCCRSEMTACHPEASANAPCTSTTVGLAEFALSVCADTEAC